ncbi:MAG: hypothetical protein R2814_04610 [Flavobacteriaceae bacterium]
MEPRFLQEVIVRDDLSDSNIVEIVVADPDGNYEYAINGGNFRTTLYLIMCCQG